MLFGNVCFHKIKTKHANDIYELADKLIFFLFKYI